MRDECKLPFVERNFCDRYRAYKTQGGAPGHPSEVEKKRGKGAADRLRDECRPIWKEMAAG